MGDISHEVLTGFRRDQHTADCRHAAMYCARRYVDIYSTELGRVFARDHSTVLHGAKRVAGVIDTTDCPMVIQEIVDAVRKELGINAEKKVAA